MKKICFSLILLKIAFILTFGIIIGYSWRALQELKSEVKIEVGIEQLSKNEKIRFNQLLKKHGLHQRLSVVYEDPLGWYFIRDGKRCPLK